MEIFFQLIVLVSAPFLACPSSFGFWFEQAVFFFLFVFLIKYLYIIYIDIYWGWGEKGWGQRQVLAASKCLAASLLQTARARGER